MTKVTNEIVLYTAKFLVSLFFLWVFSLNFLAFSMENFEFMMHIKTCWAAYVGSNQGKIVLDNTGLYRQKIHDMEKS